MTQYDLFPYVLGVFILLTFFDAKNAIEASNDNSVRINVDSKSPDLVFQIIYCAISYQQHEHY